jgi:uncharacterized repeat protein (TIGR01451 family)
LLAGASRTITATFTVPMEYTGPVPIVNTAQASSTTPDTEASNDSASVETTLNLDADVEVMKSVPASGVLVGDVIAVTIDVLNRGPNPASGVEITDNLPAGFQFVSATALQGDYDPVTGQWTVGSLAVDGTARVVIDATVTEAGSIINLAVKTGQNEPDPNPSNDTAGAHTSAAPAADLSVDKDVDRPVALVSENVTFTVRVTNRGPSEATGVTIADALPAGLTFVSATPSTGTYDSGAGIWTIGALDALAEATLTLVATVAQPGALVNNAEVASQDQVDPDPLNNNDAASVNALAAADLRVTKAASNLTPAVGGQLTYTIAVTNLGPNEATSAEISDVLPPGVTFVSATASQGTYDAGTGVWTLGAIPVTVTETLSITVRIDALGPVSNTATRQSSAPVDPNPENDSDSAGAVASLVFDLGVTKTPSSPAVAAGAPLSWTIFVTNAGPSDATDATVADVFPAAFTGASWTCTASSGSTCGAASGMGSIAATVSLAAGGNATFIATGTVAPTATGLLTNVASVAVPADGSDPDPANNSATSTVPVAMLADVQVTKTGTASVTPGGTAAVYTITVTNAGPSVASGVTLTDPTPAGLVPAGVSGACTGFPCMLGSLAPGESRVVTAAFTVPAGYTGPNSIVNTATVASTSADPDTANNSATAVTSVSAAVADLSITKTGPSSVQRSVVVTYMLTVVNAGPSDAAAVIVDDPTPAGLTFASASAPCAAGFPCSLGTLPAGGSVSITATFQVPSSFTGPGPIVNTASVAASTADPTPSNNAATATTQIDRPTTACDFDGDGRAEIVTGAGPNGGPHVRVLNLSGVGSEVASFYAYDPDYPGGVFVACGDVTGDGQPEIVTGAGPSGGPHVRVFSLAGGSETVRASFYVYDPDFSGGVFVAAGDVTGDGVADIITGAGPNGEPLVRVLSMAGGSLTERATFNAYDPTFPGGVSVAAGDVTGDGVDDIITGAGPSGAPHVRVLSLAGGGSPTERASFYAYDPAYPGGVYVAAGDVTGDGVAEIITGAGPGGGPHVRVFSLSGGVPIELASYYAYDPDFSGGVSVGAGDVDGDGVAEIVTGSGAGIMAHVRVFKLSGGGLTEIAAFFAYNAAFPGGTFVASGR